MQVMDLSSNASSADLDLVTDTLKQCSVVVDLQTNHRSRWIARRLRKSGVPVFSADKRASFRFLLVIRSWIRGRLFRKRASEQPPIKHQFKMMLDAVYAALQSMGITDAQALGEARPKLNLNSLTSSDASWLREMEFGQWLAIAAGASFPTKRPPTEVLKDSLLELRSLWPEDRPVPGIVFIGGPEDRPAAVELLDETHWKGPVINLAGKLSLEDTARAISKASVLLSSDSGLSHIAEALGVPVAVLFGPTVEEFGFLPHGPSSKAYSSTLGCRPCSKHGKQPCRYGDKLCFNSIDTRSVSRHLSSLLTAGRFP